MLICMPACDTIAVLPDIEMLAPSGMVRVKGPNRRVGVSGLEGEMGDRCRDDVCDKFIDAVMVSRGFASSSLDGNFVIAKFIMVYDVSYLRGRGAEGEKCYGCVLLARNEEEC
jgi:hypothetical protein